MSVVVYLGKNPDTKKKDYKWYTVKGSEDDAEKFLTATLRKVDTNTYADPGKLTVAEYLRKWLANYCEENLAQNTYARYKGIVENHLIPGLGRIPLAKLQPLHILDFYRESKKEGRIEKKKTEKKSKKEEVKNKELSAATVIYHHRVLHEALRHAVEWRILDNNPADAVKPPKAVKKQRKALDEKSLDILLQEARDKLIYVPVMIAAYTGMRRGEIIGLNWKDVDLKAGIIYVRQSIEWDRQEKVHKIKPTKNEESRRIDIPGKLVKALTWHKEDQKAKRKASQKAKKKADSVKGETPVYEINDCVCTMPNGKMMTLDYLTKAFGRLVKKCHFDITFHDLRHTHATILAEMGVPIRAVAERLGNDPVVAMGTYSHVSPGMQRDIVIKLEKLFDKPDTGNGDNSGLAKD